VAADLSTGTNAEELVALGVTEVVFALPRGAPEEQEVRATATRLLSHLRGLLRGGECFT